MRKDLPLDASRFDRLTRSLAAPESVAVDQAGSVYVADTYNHRIQKFHDGEDVAKFGAFGDGNGQLNNPLGVAVDLSGRVYVADWGNNRIQVFKPA